MDFLYKFSIILGLKKNKKKHLFKSSGCITALLCCTNVSSRYLALAVNDPGGGGGLPDFLTLEISTLARRVASRDKNVSTVRIFVKCFLLVYSTYM